MKNDRVIEVTFIQPKEGVSREAFGKRNLQVEFDYANKQPGFISRETAVDENGVWVLIVHWENLESAQASIEKFGTDPSVADFVEMIDPSRFKMSVYKTKF